MMKTRTLLILLILQNLVFAGSYGDAFIQASAPATSFALGGATVAYRAVYGIGLLNPAASGWDNNIRTSAVGYHYQGGLMSNYTLDQRLRLGTNWQLAALWAHVGVDGIQFRPDLINELPSDIRQDSIRTMQGQGWGQFSDQEDLGVLTLATKKKFMVDLGWKYFKIKTEVPFAVNFKYMHKSVWNASADGFGVDLGVQVGMRVVENDEPISNTTYTLGAQLNDILNTPIYWNTKHQDVVARSLRWGWQISHYYEKLNCTGALLYSNYNENGNRHHLGTEIDIAHRLQLRTGYFGGQFGIGVGVAIEKWQVDYTFSTSELTAAHRVNLAIRY
ncbi:MAG: hypothetical protein AUJ47_08205 [Candidatus Marinimicrobia bacterium CG1_02_48_14]|nr:MAG: hypothetical protein AUJ47_08205 [Candidatus Marinimicrobia bacterium CG1_02_48_14]PIZ67818.1 MAG: hypothetical protein COY19_04880 [Candidatus Marinimicrobia bacterium CG_4_10_14_0_2_um_filter_48_9]PJA53959.1 MAG: hypothetical protein CO167_06440 [Candidatus Marinimicrobia bacterium CG_4_9_14_3_um_filter_48_9]